MARAVAGVMLAVAVLAAPAQAEEPERRDVYIVKPWLDGAIIATGALASGIPLLLSNTIVTVRCPCNVDQLNALDRKVVGNENGALRTVSDVTLGLAIAAPIFARPRAWQVLDILIGVVMLAIAARLVAEAWSGLA